MKIALCGYLGSGCTEVAEILASKFVLETYNTSSILASVKGFESSSISGEVDLDQVIKAKLNEILDRDNAIIEGRSAFMALDREDVIKIFLNTPLEYRIKHVAERRGISLEDAGEDVERSDEERNNLIERLFQKDCPDVTNYDFSINTKGKTFSKTADIIADIIKSL